MFVFVKILVFSSFLYKKRLFHKGHIQCRSYHYDNISYHYPGPVPRSISSLYQLVTSPHCGAAFWCTQQDKPDIARSSPAPPPEDPIDVHNFLYSLRFIIRTDEHTNIHTHTRTHRYTPLPIRLSKVTDMYPSSRSGA